MRVKLTDALCSQKPPKKEDEPLELWDILMPGLCLRIWASGARSFSCMPRDPATGDQRRVTFKPRYPALSLADARQRVRDLEMQRQQGAPLPDPPGPKRPRDTVDRVLAIYESEVLSGHGKSWQERTTNRLRRGLAPYFKMPFHRISAIEVQQMIDDAKIVVIDKKGKTGGTQGALKLYIAFGTMLRWASKRPSYRTDQPIDEILNVQVPKKNKPRTRHFSEQEIHDFWPACEREGYPYGPASQLLVLLGLREMQVAGMTRDEVDLDEALWTIPIVEGRNKSEREFLVPLPRQAVEIIRNLPVIDNPLGLYFPNVKGDPINAWEKAGRRLAKLSRIEDWTHHDHKHTFKTNLSRLRVDKDVRDALCQHAKTGMDKDYDHWEFLPEKKVALQRWADEVERIVTGEPAKVIQIRA